MANLGVLSPCSLWLSNLGVGPNCRITSLADHLCQGSPYPLARRRRSIKVTQLSPPAVVTWKTTDNCSRAPQQVDQMFCVSVLEMNASLCWIMCPLFSFHKCWLLIISFTLNFILTSAPGELITFLTYPFNLHAWLILPPKKPRQVLPALKQINRSGEKHVTMWIPFKFIITSLQRALTPVNLS